MQKNIRQLAAVMFTDMVGYTALMQTDEQKAKKNRDRHRKVLEESTQDHHGLILQYYGDGTLSVFGSAIEAIECAVEIQKELQKEPIIPLRIGLHVGDIVYADDGIYGDAVNIASRIESLSVPGGIFISGKVYDEIKNHPELSAKLLGEFELKNVKRPIRIFALESEGLNVPSSETLKAKPDTTAKSIAVMPFVNMSSDPENEYFSDGITEELLNALTKVDGLKVTSRTSSFAFKGKNEDVRSIGSQLDVTSVLEGSVRKSGDSVRITAQLISTADGYHIWSEVYDRQLENIFEIQDEIASIIANRLKEKFADNLVKEPLIKPAAQNMEAYNLYLKGRFFFNKWSPDTSEKALVLFERAIELEPDFALAYSGLAACYCLLGSMGHLTAKTAFTKAINAVTHAIKLDDNLSEAHALIAWVRFWYEWDWEKAKTSYQKALKINPNSAETRQGYAMYLLIRSEIKRAIEEMEIAIKLDPLSLSINNSLAFAYFCAERYAEALTQFNKVIELDPSFRSALEGKGYVYVQMGKMEESIRTFKQLYKLTDDPLKGVTGLGYAFAKAGNMKEAQKCLEKLKKRGKIEKDISLNFDFVILYTGMNDYDNAFYYMKKAIEAKVGVMYLNVHPGFKNIRKDPRVKQLIKKIGLGN
jgi:TolB-like protein/Tfp pilus assembly protein PilF